MKTLFPTAAIVLLAISCSSSSKLNTKEAVKQAVVEHLSSRKGLDLDMTAMDLDIGDVSFRESEAEAAVSFRPKGSQTSAMTMKYQLAREGDKWRVKAKAGADANPHGAGGMPEAPPAGAMPPGHPPVGGAKQ